AVVDEESAGDDVDAHVLRSSRALVLVQGQADEFSTLLGGEATGLRGVVDDGHDHFVEQTRTAGDDIEMTHGERVIGTGTDDLHSLIGSAWGLMCGRPRRPCCGLEEPSAPARLCRYRRSGETHRRRVRSGRAESLPLFRSECR